MWQSDYSVHHLNLRTFLHKSKTNGADFHTLAGIVDIIECFWLLHSSPGQ